MTGYLDRTPRPAPKFQRGDLVTIRRTDMVGTVADHPTWSKATAEHWPDGWCYRLNMGDRAICAMETALDGEETPVMRRAKIAVIDGGKA